VCVCVCVYIYKRDRGRERERKEKIFNIETNAFLICHGIRTFRRQTLLRKHDICYNRFLHRQLFTTCASFTSNDISDPRNISLAQREERKKNRRNHLFA